jgi:hypothetical protein
MTGGDCTENTDPLRLVRQGTSKVDRAGTGPAAALVRVDERRPEHAMVFAAAYARYLKYVDLDGNPDGHWEAFFDSDLSARLAVAAVEDVGVYRTTVKALQRALEDPEPPPSAPAMVATLGAVFDGIGTLAVRLDDLAGALPREHRLRETLANLIRSQLSPMLRRLLGYHAAGQALAVIDPSAPPPADVVIFGRGAERFAALTTGPGLSAPEWPAGVGVGDWAAYVALDPAVDYAGAYGPPGTTTVERVNHLATHNLFTAASEAFLAVYARVVEEAGAAVEASFADDRHEPHYALFMAFLKLLEHARGAANTITGRHLDFYYRDVLRLRERPAEPSHAHVLVELAKHVDSHLVAGGTLLRAGKDAAGADVHFAVDRDLVTNRAAVADLRRVYRHPSSKPLPNDRGRLFAKPAPVGLGAPWHPFVEEVYTDGLLTAIDMPPAEVGFAIAAHVLWMAEGKRSIEVTLELAGKAHAGGGGGTDRPVRLRCLLTTAKGWIKREVDTLTVRPGQLGLALGLDGDDPPVTPYDPATHGYSFATRLPVLLVQLVHHVDAPWDYPALKGVPVRGVTVHVEVTGVRSLVLANDHGPVDPAKPFLAYGSTPMRRSSLVIGSSEVFQKALTELTINGQWMATPVAHGTTPNVSVQFLSGGTWGPRQRLGSAVATPDYTLTDLPAPPPGAPDLTPAAPYSTATRAGFLRLRLNGGFGTDTYPVALAAWITGRAEDEPPAPVLPMLASLTLDYTAEQRLDLAAPSEGGGRFLHVTPFGHAEQTLGPTQSSLPLLPQFRAGSKAAEGELYVGVRGLAPPQNLALLFQVVDGTANPLAAKPDDHVDWSYLRGNAWVRLAADQVADGTDDLLASGVVTIAVPADATTEHTLLPPGLHWIRLAVAAQSDAVCRLLGIAAQALSTTCVARDAGDLPPRTISKLDPPDAAVKGVAQPFPTFGGLPVETTAAFTTRVSERLRHKDRAITLWDYEHLVLDAFPAIYQVRCLNHTRYEPSLNGAGVYRELAPGHVTVVTIPDLALPDPRDPLRPFTSLRVLGEIERFLAPRMSCFARLHVRNPQFEEVRADLRVRFRHGVDETFHVNALKREITQFLSPWAFRGDARPTFNGTVHKSVLVDFVEERPYVDYVTDVRLFHRLPGATADGPDLDEVSGSRAISILVSVPARRHGVQVIHSHGAPAPEECSCAAVVV